ncbi:MAG: hypothetical protein KDK51_01465 [Deltaproteobacteria bacterium]|nr:hypothetical protein [Deltaproteobacteria bacterium]
MYLSKRCIVCLVLFFTCFLDLPTYAQDQNTTWDRYQIVDTLTPNLFEHRIYYRRLAEMPFADRSNQIVPIPEDLQLSLIDWPLHLLYEREIFSKSGISSEFSIIEKQKRARTVEKFVLEKFASDTLGEFLYTDADQKEIEERKTALIKHIQSMSYQTFFLSLATAAKQSMAYEKNDDCLDVTDNMRSGRGDCSDYTGVMIISFTYIKRLLPKYFANIYVSDSAYGGRQYLNEPWLGSIHSTTKHAWVSIVLFANQSIYIISIRSHTVHSIEQSSCQRSRH